MKVFDKEKTPIYDPELATRLEEWFRAEGRDLPWRGPRDPYLIWISEVILQQTRVAQGTAYYHRFVERFPTVENLAAASEDEVLKCWQGLGYYSRARNLHAAAKQVMTLHGGAFPADYTAVRALRGVGDYTAAAICSFAADGPYAVLDGNVFRVLSRLYDIDTPIDTTTGRKFFQQLAQQLLDKIHPSLYNQAIMDFGALCCLPANPRCCSDPNACPLQDRCLAFAAGTVAKRPVKQGRTTVTPRYFNYLHLQCDGRTALHRRDAKDIWQGLYEFPLLETDRPMPYEELAATPEFRALFRDSDPRLLKTTAMPVHQLSHRAIHALFHRIELDEWTPALHAYRLVPDESLGDYAVPRLVDRYLAHK